MHPELQRRMDEDPGHRSRRAVPQRKKTAPSDDDGAAAIGDLLHDAALQGEEIPVVNGRLQVPKGCRDFRRAEKESPEQIFDETRRSLIPVLQLAHLGPETFRRQPQDFPVDERKPEFPSRQAADIRAAAAHLPRQGDRPVSPGVHGPSASPAFCLKNTTIQARMTSFSRAARGIRASSPPVLPSEGPGPAETVPAVEEKADVVRLHLHHVPVFLPEPVREPGEAKGQNELGQNGETPRVEAA